MNKVKFNNVSIIKQLKKLLCKIIYKKFTYNVIITKLNLYSLTIKVMKREVG